MTVIWIAVRHQVSLISEYWWLLTRSNFFSRDSWELHVRGKQDHQRNCAIMCIQSSQSPETLRHVREQGKPLRPKCQSREFIEFLCHAVLFYLIVYWNVQLFAELLFFLKCKLFVNLIGFYGFRFTTDLLKSNIQKVFGILLWIYNTYIKHKLSQTRFLRCMLTPWYAYWDFLQCPYPLTHCEFSVVSIVRISQGMPCRSRLE